MTRPLRCGHLLVLCLVLSACGPTGAPTAPAPATSGSLAATDDPVATDAGVDSLRASAAAAMAQQRIYAPAGDNAIEHYLALRPMLPDDDALATALLELLPYALIGSEQALARGDFGESRRLLDLVGRADPQSPALGRLRDAIVAGEADVARRAIAEAEAARLLALQQAEAAEQGQAAASRAAPVPILAPASPPVARIADVPPAAPVRAPAPDPAPAEVRSASPPIAASAAAPATATIGMPQLISAPTPRYPSMAYRRKIEGEVVIAFTIQPDGSVASPRVVSATPPGTFDEAALAAARRWKFQPTPVRVETSRLVRFRLPGAAP